MTASFQVKRLSRDEVREFVGAVAPHEVTLTGWVGSGYSLVTDVLGDEVHRLGLTGPWETKYLLMMRDQVPASTEAVLRDLGLGDTVAVLRTLALGTGLLVTSQQPG